MLKVCKKEDNKRIPIKEHERKEGNTPYFGANGIQGYIDGYTHDGTNILIAEDGANNVRNYPIKLITGKIWVNNHAHVLKVNTKTNNGNFLVGAIKKINFYRYLVGSSRYKLTAESLNQVKIKIAKQSEQEKIGELLKNIEELLTLYERKIEKLESIYHYFQKNIFKHLYETKDTLNLGDFVSVNTGKLDANAMCNDGKYDFYTSGIKKYKINSFSFSGPAITVAGNGATIGYLHLADGKFDAYQRTYVINNFQGVSRKYIYYTLQYVLPRKIYKESRTGSIPYIVKEMLTGLKIPELDNSTQKLIGSFFYKVNNLITSYKQIHNELTKIKSFCLNTMFI